MRQNLPVEIAPTTDVSAFGQLYLRIVVTEGEDQFRGTQRQCHPPHRLHWTA